MLITRNFTADGPI